MSFSYIYLVKLTEHLIVYSGIGFEDFYQGIKPKIGNILVLNGDVIGNKNVKNFEVFEGEKAMQLLSEQLRDSDNFQGDFHFVDYNDPHALFSLSEDNIKELLYMSHMWEPKASNAFETLNNRFVYMSHDNDWYCKLYINHGWDSFENMVKTKIRTCMRSKMPLSSKKGATIFRQYHSAGKDEDNLIHDFDDRIIHEIMTLCKEGLYIDLEAVRFSQDHISIDMYTVGKIDSIDDMLNHIEKYKKEAKTKRILLLDNNGWKLLKSIE